ncbi:MAG: parvulin peptidyl-prolyl isomerase [Lentisphaerae bacterium]|nr:MAG: parvulin peptidyl-prolyl isomerase [Lentisphaerota bacterium]
MKPLAELLEDENKEPEEIAASHILIAYKGAERAGANVTRSKEEARKLAEKVLKMAKEGKDFAELARKYSDGPSKSKGGDLGTFKKGVMHKNFEKAAWKLKVNEICDSIVETPFGFHIIKRTK